jgi:hypothetical protein
MQKHAMRRHWPIDSTWSMQNFALVKHVAKAVSLLLLQPVFRRISDREAFLFCGLQRVSNPNLISRPVIIIRVYNGGEMKGRKSRDYSLTTTPPGLWPTRSASWMATRHDGVRVICASRRKMASLCDGDCVKIDEP